MSLSGPAQDGTVGLQTSPRTPQQLLPPVLMLAGWWASLLSSLFQQVHQVLSLTADDQQHLQGRPVQLSWQRWSTPRGSGRYSARHS